MAAVQCGQAARAGVAAEEVGAQAVGRDLRSRGVLQVGAKGVTHQFADGAPFLGAALVQLVFQLGRKFDGDGHGVRGCDSRIPNDCPTAA